MSEGDPFANRNGPLAVTDHQMNQGSQPMTQMQQQNGNVQNLPQQNQQYQPGTQDGNSANKNVSNTGTLWGQAPAHNWGQFSQPQ